MNFTVERSADNGFQLVRLRDNLSGSWVSILPSPGAILHEFVIREQGKYINIVDNYANPAELEQFLSYSFKGPKLSPFPCRVKKGEWQYGDEKLVFDNRFADGTAIHGLLYNRDFNITAEYSDDEMASVSLRHHYRGDNPGYPFEYNCEVKYQLQGGNLLQVETTLTNLSGVTIPVADGWHPYFTLGGKIDDYILLFAASSVVQNDEHLIPTGKIVAEPSFRVAHRLGERQLDTCYVVETEGTQPACVVHNPLNKLTLSVFASENYPFLQVFTPPHRNSIAIENLSAAPNALNNGIGIEELEAGRSVTFNCYYQVS